MIIVGAGLSGLMTAWRCLDVNPELTITIIEGSDRIAGDHTWSFNLSDIDESLHEWIKPFIAYQWDRYDVKFPDYDRTLDITYCTGNSVTLRKCVQPFIDEGRLNVVLNTKVKVLELDKIVTEQGEKLEANCVLDARGFEHNENVFLGYQKFVGHVIKTEQPHGVKHPIIMDATVDQLGGYRFVYCLPYTDTEILVEDTYYTDGAEMNSQEVDARIKDYIRKNLNLSEYTVQHREKSVLPITLGLENKFRPLDSFVPEIGIRGGFYHAVTGYSVPDAVKNADNLSFKVELWEQSIDPMTIGVVVEVDRNEHFKSEYFFRLLNRMLFRAAKPEERYKVLQRFYKLNEGLVRRFYAGKLTFWDKARILIGKPPVPIHLALYNFSEKAFMRRERQKRKKES